MLPPSISELQGRFQIVSAVRRVFRPEPSSAYRGFASSPEKIELWIRITLPVTIGVFLRVISISHDEKADSERDKDTLKKGIKRRVFVISIDQSGYEYHKNSEVSPGNRQKRQKNSEFWPILRIIRAKSAA